MRKYISAVLIMILLAGGIMAPGRTDAFEDVKRDEEPVTVIEKPPEVSETFGDYEVIELPEGSGSESAWIKAGGLDGEKAVEDEKHQEEPEATDNREESEQMQESPALVLAMNEGDGRFVENVVLKVGEKVSYGNWSTNYFYINGQLAYCLEPRKGTPSSGNYIAEVLQNDNLTKGMYYLMGGPGFTPEIREAFFSSAAGFTEKQIYAYCHAVLSFIYSGYNLNSDAFLGLSGEERDGISTISYQIRDLLPAPPEGRISIQPAHQSARWDHVSRHQWTDPYQVVGDARNVLRFVLPEGVKLHNLVTGAVMQTNAEVKGGDSFQLEGEAHVSGRWTSGKIKGSIQETYMSFLVRPPGDDQAVGGLAAHREPEITTEFGVDWMSQGKLRLRKKSQTSGDALAGAEFGIYARDKIVRNGVVLAEAGEKMTQVVTDVSGMAESELLPSEAYYIVREQKAPEGYQMSAELAGGIEVYISNKAEIIEEGVPIVELELSNDLKVCSLTVQKVIKSSDIVWANGNPTFLFRISGEDLEGRKHTYTRAMEFTKAYADKHTDKNGNVSMKAVFEHIPCGRNYSVTELETNRYVLQDVKTEDSNITVERLQESVYGTMPERIFEVHADLYEKPEGSTVCFINQKIRWDDWSHNAIAVNEAGIEK